ncbi:MAG: 50S ribosomal protein L22 [Candidatus Cloacimonadota bacterium]|nr:50S ribosomal protein L22 [Candidatus Cloacimonadota bacterium]
MEAIAKVKDQKGSATKVRLVADLIRNKKIEEAKSILHFSKKHSAKTVLKVLNAAIANMQVKESKLQLNDLYINKIFIDEGRTMKRTRPRARGMADLIRKRTHHIMISVSDLNLNKEEGAKNGS